MAKEENITDFKNYKKIHKLTKPRSPLVIEIMTDDFPSEWLTTVITYKAKSGQVTDHHLILQNEIKDRLDWYKRGGYILTET